MYYLEDTCDCLSCLAEVLSQWFNGVIGRALHLHAGEPAGSRIKFELSVVLHFIYTGKYSKLKLGCYNVGLSKFGLKQ